MVCAFPDINLVNYHFEKQKQKTTSLVIRQWYLVNWLHLLLLWPDRWSRPEGRQMWLGADSRAPTRFLRHCLTRCSTTKQKQDQNKAWNVQLSAGLHHPVKQSLFRNHPGHKHQGLLCCFRLIRAEPINQISSPHFQIARPSESSIRSLMWITQEKNQQIKHKPNYFMLNAIMMLNYLLYSNV